MLLVEKLDRLQQAAGDIRVGRGRRLIDELLQAARERAFLRIGRARAVVEGPWR